MCESLGQWRALGDDPATRLKADANHTALKEFLAKHLKAKASIEGKGCNDDASVRLQVAVEESAKEVENAKEALIAAASAKVKAKHDACSDCLQEIEWPCPGAHDSLGWEDFQVKGGSWLNYHGGDSLRTDGQALQSLLDYSIACHQMFGDELGKDINDEVQTTTNKIEALVFTVKAVRSIIGMASDNKRKRYASTKLKDIDKPGFASIRPFLPNAVIEKLEADRSL